MPQQKTATAYLDPHANLSDAHKTAALKAGFGISFLTDEQIYAQTRAQQQAQEISPPQVK